MHTFESSAAQINKRTAYVLLLPGASVSGTSNSTTGTAGTGRGRGMAGKMATECSVHAAALHEHVPCIPDSTQLVL